MTQRHERRILKLFGNARFLSLDHVDYPTIILHTVLTCPIGKAGALVTQGPG